MASTVQDLLHVHALIRALTGRDLGLELKAENTPAVTLVTRERFVAHGWRRRHFALRASWLRDMTATRDILAEHAPGAGLVADLLTKSIPKCRLPNLEADDGIDRHKHMILNLAETGTEKDGEANAG